MIVPIIARRLDVRYLLIQSTRLQILKEKLCEVKQYSLTDVGLYKM